MDNVTSPENEPTFADLLQSSLNTAMSTTMIDILIDATTRGRSPEQVAGRLSAKGYAARHVERTYEDPEYPELSNVVLIIEFDDDSCLIWNEGRDFLIASKDRQGAEELHHDALIGVAEQLSDPYPQREWPSAEND